MVRLPQGHSMHRSRVERDPLPARAVDEARSPCTADAIAERPIPEPSVLTARARCFALLGYLPWPRERVHQMGGA